MTVGGAAAAASSLVPPATPARTKPSSRLQVGTVTILINIVTALYSQSTVIRVVAICARNLWSSKGPPQG